MDLAGWFWGAVDLAFPVESDLFDPAAPTPIGQSGGADDDVSFARASAADTAETVETTKTSPSIESFLSFDDDTLHFDLDVPAPGFDATAGSGAGGGDLALDTGAGILPPGDGSVPPAGELDLLETDLAELSAGGAWFEPAFEFLPLETEPSEDVVLDEMPLFAASEVSDLDPDVIPRPDEPDEDVPFGDLSVITDDEPELTEGDVWFAAQHGPLLPYALDSLL